ncbi:hypothetical protein SCANM63S_09457 [Streptomyces canarius]
MDANPSTSESVYLPEPKRLGARSPASLPSR